MSTRLRQIASNSAAEQRRSVGFRDKWINKPLPYEQMRELLTQIATDVRDQVADYRDLTLAATRLAELTPEPAPPKEEERSFDRRALFTRLIRPDGRKKDSRTRWSARRPVEAAKRSRFRRQSPGRRCRSRSARRAPAPVRTSANSPRPTARPARRAAAAPGRRRSRPDRRRSAWSAGPGRDDALRRGSHRPV